MALNSELFICTDLLQLIFMAITSIASWTMQSCILNLVLFYVSLVSDRTIERTSDFFAALS
jgi:hypothetical protein